MCQNDWVKVYLVLCRTETLTIKLICITVVKLINFRFLSPLVTVFDDGDEKTLRRSSLCLKGERHFAESEVRVIN